MFHIQKNVILKQHFNRVICNVQANASLVCWPFLFQLCQTILDPDDRTQKVEYLEIGVYRTTPLMPDRGLVGDNRSSKVFEFATFSSSTQSRRDFFFSLFSPPADVEQNSWGLFPSIRTILFLFLSSFAFLLFLPFTLPFFRLLDAESVSSFTSVLHTVCSCKYKIYGCRYCEICGRCGARPKAGRFQVEIAFWRLIDSWLLESEWCYYGARSGTRRTGKATLVASSEVA